MSDRSSDEELAGLVRELVGALRDLERELEQSDARRVPGFPTPGELRRFTSEVAIPGLILVLETNVRALRLLQRALELGEDVERAGEEASELRDRATAASETTLRRLDDALAGLQRAVEDRPGNDEAAELVAEARALRDEVRSRLAERPGGADGATGEDGRGDGAGHSEDAVEIDVDAELESIRDELDADDAAGPDDSTGDGTDGEDRSGDDSPDGVEG